MRKLIVLAQMSALMIFAVVAASAPSHATTHATTDQPWCVIFGGAQGAMEDCTMRTFEECRQEMIAGNRGSCFRNPYYHADWQPGRPQHSGTRHRG